MAPWPRFRLQLPVLKALYAPQDKNFSARPLWRVVLFRLDEANATFRAIVVRNGAYK